MGYTPVNFDASKLQLTEIDKISGRAGNQNSFTASGACRFKGLASEVAVSPAGLMIGQIDPQPNQFHTGMLIPLQSHSIDELAGDWNFIGHDRSGADTSPIALISATATIARDGKVLPLTQCNRVTSACQSKANGLQILSSSAAMGLYGFDVDPLEPGGTVAKLFAYRSGSGELMLVILTPSTFLIGARKAAPALPTVGRVSETAVLTVIPQSYPKQSVSDTRSTVATVDSMMRSYTRSLVLNASTGVTRSERIVLDDPSTGFQRRPSATVTASDGSSSSVLEWVMLDLPGAGLSATGFLASNQLQLAVAK